VRSRREPEKLIDRKTSELSPAEYSSKEAPRGQQNKANAETLVFRIPQVSKRHSATRKNETRTTRRGGRMKTKGHKTPSHATPVRSRATQKPGAVPSNITLAR